MDWVVKWAKSTSVYYSDLVDVAIEVAVESLLTAAARNHLAPVGKRFAWGLNRPVPEGSYKIAFGDGRVRHYDYTWECADCGALVRESGISFVEMDEMQAEIDQWSHWYWDRIPCQNPPVEVRYHRAGKRYRAHMMFWRQQLRFDAWMKERNDQGLPSSGAPSGAPDDRPTEADHGPGEGERLG